MRRQRHAAAVALVRPDKHVGWRSMTLPRIRRDALRDAAPSILQAG
jgi:hypothetical protein